MSDTTLPPDHERPSEDELRQLLRRGTGEFGVVTSDGLTAIWRAIDDELDLEEPTVRAAVDGAGSGTTGASTRDAGASTGHGPSPAAARAASRWSRFVPTAAAAGIALVVGVGAGLALAPSADEPAPVTVASWDLEPLDDAPVEGAGATLTEDDGTRTIELALGDLPTTDGFHEVWLLDPSTGALTSLGPVRPDGRYVVPSGTDLTTLTALDVSAEPLDGDPGHSGASLLRGEVVFTG